jgi:hypothetical protein
VGSFTAQAVRLTNSGTGVLSLTTAPMVSGDAAFSSTTNCQATLASGGYCDTSVKFSPSSVNPVTGTLSFASSVGNQTVSLSGTGLAGTGQLAAAPGSSTDFGVLPLGGSAIRTLQFTNTGTRPVSGVYATVSGSGLSITSNAPNSCGTQASPGSIAAGASCQFSVTYAPAEESILADATAKVVSSASNSPGSVALTGAGQAAGDPYFANVSLLLNGEAFADQSSTATAVTVNGTAALSKTQSKFGGSAYWFPGLNSASISMPVNAAATNLGTGAVTLEFWVRPESVKATEECIIGAAQGSNNARSFYICTTNGSPAFIWYPDGTGGSRRTLSFGTGTLTANVWHHMAVTRDGSGVLRTFLDGTVIASTSTSTAFAYPTGSRFEIGKEANYASGAFTGYIDDVRVTKGVARYTGNFSVPTAAFSTH